ncbi:MAG: NUDIX hydrolase, partial [Gammaproteobacteria bacterium]|nr:NUDIX hydrolase [Gammaproteobacteria bacterium]
MRAQRLSAGVVVVRTDRDGPRYLLLRAYRYWDFPKGEV